ncbi:hypothetical protein DRW03_01060 [Corallococcus sp. H22C18031201]|uniref:hypothetical protein n=1 Tax=Citreicoccus inhibens TaxID=2849499 RepID=UPI000E7466C6|nr:hypothetical protein [Citreicoccus inhibens]MBU8898276.1 hypothetical protein [Citreicoccus inhibens]RJS27004.1 hypothetical protein DRW03_01060 [Corallococcus sp. H22C18031201]
MTEPSFDPESELALVRDERARRIEELEARLSTRGRVGVRPSVALMGMVLGLALLAVQWQDLAYFASSATPLTLGAEGDYRYERLVTNRYAQVHGIPTSRGAYERQGDSFSVLVGLRDSPFVVRRAPLPGERWDEGRPPSRPDPTPFAMRGRLLSEEEAPRYREAFALLRAQGEVQPREGRLWLLVEGERPGADRGRLLVALMLSAFVCVNAVLLARGIRRR